MATIIGNLEIFIVLPLGNTHVQLMIIKHFQNISCNFIAINLTELVRFRYKNKSCSYFHVLPSLHGCLL